MAFNPHEQLERTLFSGPLLQDVLKARKDSPLPPEAPLFHHLTYYAAQQFNHEALGFGREEFEKRFLQPALMFVEEFTSTQSLKQLQQRKWAIFEMVSGTGPFQSIGSEKRHWFRKLSEILGLFPDRRELEQLVQGREPKEVWRDYEAPPIIESRPPEEKIIPFELAVILARQINNEGRRLGLNIGKYRLGIAHSAYGENLRGAKTILGPNGVLFVGVESADSFAGRLNQERPVEETIAHDDWERLRQIAELPADYVFLVDPTFGGSIDIRGVDLEKYFFQVWLKLLPNFYFMGYANHELRPVFERYARQLGVFPLYREEQETASTTDIIRQIRKAV